MIVTTPEILWHGGGIDNGKPDPVFSVDIHYPSSILATAGIDASIPPKGSVRLWHIDYAGNNHEFIIDLADHQSSVNVVRFSPCGKFLASASDRQIVIYSVLDGCTWADSCEIRNIERTWLRPSLCEMYDLCWSPDSQYMLACSIDQKAEIIRVTSRDSIILPGHTHYVQGVAWDPLNQMVITQSADRSIKLHMLKAKQGAATKLAPRGHVVIKMLENTTPGPAAVLTAADFNTKGKNLYADSTVPSFFRRPSFSPDGAIFVTPSGIHKHSITSANGTSNTNPISANNASNIQQSFCTHIFSRNHHVCPIASLVGLEDPSVAVRFSPVLYKLIATNKGVSVNSATSKATDPLISKGKSPITRKQILENMENSAMIPGKYRMVFAVLTVSAVMVYDTQFPHPIARFGGLHLACINDATWSADGNMLIVCSSDGYVSFIQFECGALGEPISRDEVPDTVKHTFASIYLPPEPSAKVLATEQAQAQVHAAMANRRSAAQSSSTAAPSALMAHIISDRKLLTTADADLESSAENAITPHLLKRASSSSSSQDLDMISPVATEAFTVGDSASTVLASASIVPTISIDTEGGQKKKKRIATTFVGPLSSTAPTSGSSDANVISIVATAVAPAPAPASTSTSTLELSEALVVATVETASDQIPSSDANHSNQLTEGKTKKRVSTTLLSSVPLSFHSPTDAARFSAMESHPIGLAAPPSK